MHSPASETPLLVRGGRIINPADGIDATGDVLIAGGVIAGIETSPGKLQAPEGTREIDAEGCIVAPGLLDIHVHFREPGPAHDETIATGAMSAISGGFSTVCCMPNTTPPIDSAIMVDVVRRRAADADAARVYTIGCATRGRAGETPAEIGAMTQAGAVGFSDDGDVVADAGVMSQVLKTIAANDRVFMQHCQEPSLTRGAVMNAGPLATRLGLGGWPRVAEEVVIERDVRLNGGIGCRYHAQHLSSGGSVEIIRRARAAGQPVTAEVSPHHLLLTEEACRGYDTAAKMNPPLRAAADIELLKAGVADGTITVLATDHAPHPAHTKQRPFFDASFGIVGLECALALYVEALVTTGVIGWPRLIAMMTSEPACVSGLDRIGLGRLAVGGPADLTVIDPALAWSIDPDDFETTGRNCPFAGRSVTGRAVATIVAGRIRLMRAAERSDRPAPAAR